MEILFHQQNSTESEPILVDGALGEEESDDDDVPLAEGLLGFKGIWGQNSNK